MASRGYSMPRSDRCCAAIRYSDEPDLFASMQLLRQRKGAGNGHDVDALFLELADFFAGGRAANRAPRRLLVENPARFLGEARAHILGTVENVLDEFALEFLRGIDHGHRFRFARGGPTIGACARI